MSNLCYQKIQKNLPVTEFDIQHEGSRQSDILRLLLRSGYKWNDNRQVYER